MSRHSLARRLRRRRRTTRPSPRQSDHRPTTAEDLDDDRHRYRRRLRRQGRRSISRHRSTTTPERRPLRAAQRRSATTPTARAAPTPDQVKAARRAATSTLFSASARPPAERDSQGRGPRRPPRDGAPTPRPPRPATTTPACASTGSGEATTALDGDPDDLQATCAASTASRGLEIGRRPAGTRPTPVGDRATTGRLRTRASARLLRELGVALVDERVAGLVGDARQVELVGEALLEAVAALHVDRDRCR